MSDDVFVVLGNEVSAAAVEAGLQAHPAVAEAAVIGVPDPFVGFIAKGFVRLRPGAHATPRELVAFCKQRMPRHMYPRQVEILDQLPRTGAGEVDRVALGNQELARMRGQRFRPPHQD